MSDDVLRLSNDALQIDMDSFTLDEIDALEEIIDGPIDVALNQVATARKGKVLRALAVVMKNREDPGGYPIGSPDDLAETRRKVGRLRIVVDTPPPAANGGPPPLPGPDAAAVPHASSSPPVSAATSGA